MPIDPQHPLRIPTKKWGEKLKNARRFKRDHFDQYAEEGMDFYTGYKPLETWRNHMEEREEGDIPYGGDTPMPTLQFKFVSARVAELVQIYGPMLYHRNPVRNVTPRQLVEIPLEVFEMQVPPVPPPNQMQMQQAQAAGMDPQQLQQQHQQAQQQRQQQIQQLHQQAMENQGRSLNIANSRAKLMETYLNYTPNELNLKKHSRQAIEETLIKGRGVVWTELRRAYDGGPAMVGTFYDSIDNLVIDPDADEWESATWIARRRFRPVWKVAEDFGLNEDYLRKHGKVGHSSLNEDAERGVDRDYNLDEVEDGENTNDNIEYWEVYSRMGMGDKLSGIPEEYRGTLEEFGDDVYLVIANGIDFPLNLPERLVREATESEEAFEEAFERVQWPIPFWIDNEWPATPLEFHFIPNNPWPLAHIRPGLPELKFSNWVTSFLAEHSRHTSRLFFGHKAGLDEEIIDRIKYGGGIEHIPLGALDGRIDENIQFLTPPKNSAADLWNIKGSIDQDFDKRTGLAEAMYAAPGGMRSASEAKLKEGAINIRPDDMANRVEDWMSLCARKEALAAQWLLEEEDVAFVLGPEGAKLWEQLIVPADPGSLALEYDYRIEAGSARKPNKEQKIENMQNALQNFPNIWQMAGGMADPAPANALIRDWAKANDIENVDRYLVPPPDPQIQQQQMQMQQQQMQLEQQKLQLEAAKMQAELQEKGMDAQIKQLEMAFKQQEAQMDMAAKQQEMEQDQQEHEQELAQDQQEHAQEMEQEREKSLLQMNLERMMGQTKLDIAEKQGEAKVKQMRAQAAAKPKPTQGA